MTGTRIMPVQPNKATRRAVYRACARKKAYPTMEAAEVAMPPDQGAYRCSWGVPPHWHRMTKRPLP